MADEQKMGNVVIPPDIFVRCPMAQATLRAARRCDGCAHFRGLAQRAQSGARRLTFREEFFVQCAHPVVRELYSVEIEAPLA